MVSDSGENRLDVSSALEALRAELEDAWREGQQQPVQFGIDDITLTLTVVASRKKAGNGKIRWYVVEAGGDMSHDDSLTQTLELKLKPALVDPRSEQTWPLRVSGLQAEPGD